MALTLVTGPANAAKAGSVLGAFRARLDEDPLLVVPRMDDVDHHQRELAADGVLLGGHVVRFEWLFEEIARRTGYTARRASALQVELIAAYAVRRADLRALAASAARPGFTRAAVRLFAELERSRVEPQRLAVALQRWAADGPRASYAREVAALYRAYRAGLDAAGLVDRELFAWRALDQLRHEPQRWGRTPVFVYGFDDFADLQLDTLETLATRCEADVVVSLPYERARIAFKSISKAFAELSRVARGVEELPALDDHYADESRAMLHALERSLFEHAALGASARRPPASARGSSRRRGAPAPIRLLSAGGLRAEVELVAAQVLDLLRGGTRPGDVAVVFRDPRRYAALVAHVFDSYGIPYSVDRRIPLGHTALGRGLLALLRCAGGSGSAADLLTYLRTPGRLRKPALADRLEAHARRNGIRGADQAAHAFEQVGGWPLDEIARLRGAAPAELPDAIAAIAAARFSAPYLRAAHVLTGTELADARVYEAIRTALADIAAVARAGVRPDLRALHEMLAELEVRAGDTPDPARVQVASPETIRARRFEAVFACGLQEGEWPAPPGGDPFLSDDDRREIAQAGGLVLQAREDQLDRERYLFYATISRAERVLYLSWRHSDDDGNPEARSFFVEDVCDLFGDVLREPLVRGLADVTWPLDAAPTELEWERAVARLGPRHEPVVATRLSTPALAAWLGDRGGFSAGMLEAFGECPVRWLVDRVLEAEALEPDPQHLVRGSFAHRVLERTYRGLREQTGSARVTTATLGTAERILHDALREAQESGDFQLSPSQTRVQAAVRKLEFDLLRYLHHEAENETGLEPVELELSFGLANSALPALKLDGIEIRGVIDRVDRSNGHALIVDYKSGKNVMGVAKWADKGKLQAPLYALVARELLGLVPIGAVYQPLAGDDLRARGVVDSDHRDELGDRFVRTDWRDHDGFQEALEDARQTVRDVVARMREGDIKPKPGCCSGGTGCAYPSICRVRKGSQWS